MTWLVEGRAPHLTDENHAELLARAGFRTKKEIRRLVAEVAPQPDVPARIEPLAPQPSAVRATWRVFAEGLAGPYRDISPGNGRQQAPVAPDGRDVAFHPRDESAVGETLGAPETAQDLESPWCVSARVDPGGGPDGQHAPARVGSAASEEHAPPQGAVGEPGAAPQLQAAQLAAGNGPDGQHALARVAELARAQPLRYKIQFTAEQEYVDLLEEAGTYYSTRSAIATSPSFTYAPCGHWSTSFASAAAASLPQPKSPVPVVTARREWNESSTHEWNESGAK